MCIDANLAKKTGNLLLGQHLRQVFLDTRHAQVLDRINSKHTCTAQVAKKGLQGCQFTRNGRRAIRPCSFIESEAIYSSIPSCNIAHFHISIILIGEVSPSSPRSVFSVTFSEV